MGKVPRCIGSSSSLFVGGVGVILQDCLIMKEHDENEDRRGGVPVSESFEVENPLHEPLIEQELRSRCNKKLFVLSTIAILLFVITIGITTVIVNAIFSTAVFTSCKDYESFALKNSFRIRYVVFTKTFNCTKLIFPVNSFYRASVSIAGIIAC